MFPFVDRLSLRPDVLLGNIVVGADVVTTGMGSWSSPPTSWRGTSAPATGLPTNRPPLKLLTAPTSASSSRSLRRHTPPAPRASSPAIRTLVSRDRIESETEETRQSLHVLDPFFNLVAAQTPSGAIPSIVVDPDVVSLDSRRDAIEMEAEGKEDGKLHATVRRANTSRSDIFSLQSSRNPTPTLLLSSTYRVLELASMASGEQAAPFLLAAGAEQQARRGGRGRFPSLVACATAGMNITFVGEMGHGHEWVP